MATGSTNAIGPVDDVPTLGSTNLVKSGGVAKKLLYHVFTGATGTIPVTWATYTTQGSSCYSATVPTTGDRVLSLHSSGILITTQSTTYPSTSSDRNLKNKATLSISDIVITDWDIALPSNANGYIEAWFKLVSPGSSTYYLVSGSSTFPKLKVNIVNGEIDSIQLMQGTFVSTATSGLPSTFSIYIYSVNLDNLTFS